jgi:hypothetical protein
MDAGVSRREVAMDPSELADRILNGDVLFYIVGGAVAIVGIILGTVTSMVKATAREKTRREIAAYIAEGSMTPEQGERLMAAGNPKKC